MDNLTMKLLNAVSLFEGSRGGKINVWDEQYLSLGTLHYAVGQGSGARFLMRVHELDSAGFVACLGADFGKAVQGGVPSIKEYCRRHVWKQHNRWYHAFVALSRLKAFKQADAEAARPYLAGAYDIAKRYGLTSELGLAFAFDRCVQQGPAARRGVDNAFRRLPPGTSEQKVMEVLADAYAATANPKYRHVVLKRALTFAHGSSARSGYPGDVDLERDFGISPVRRWHDNRLPTVFLKHKGDGPNVEWDGITVPYGGQTISRHTVAALAKRYAKPGVYKLSSLLVLEVYRDGALQFCRLEDFDKSRLVPATPLQ